MNSNQHDENQQQGWDLLMKNMSTDIRELRNAMIAMRDRMDLFVTRDTFFKLYYVLIMLICTILGACFFSAIKPRINASYLIVDQEIIKEGKSNKLEMYERITADIEKSQ